MIFQRVRLFEHFLILTSFSGHLVLPKLIIPSIIMDYKGSSQRQDLEVTPRETSYCLAEPTDLETPQSRPTYHSIVDDLTSFVEGTCKETPWSGPTSGTKLDGLTSPAEPTYLETAPTETSYGDLMSECYDELVSLILQIMFLDITIVTGKNKVQNGLFVLQSSTMFFQV